MMIITMIMEITLMVDTIMEMIVEMVLPMEIMDMAQEMALNMALVMIQGMDLDMALIIVMDTALLMAQVMAQDMDLVMDLDMDLVMDLDMVLDMALVMVLAMALAMVMITNTKKLMGMVVMRKDTNTYKNNRLYTCQLLLALLLLQKLSIQIFLPDQMFMSLILLILIFPRFLRLTHLVLPMSILQEFPRLILQEHQRHTHLPLLTLRLQILLRHTLHLLLK